MRMPDLASPLADPPVAEADRAGGQAPEAHRLRARDGEPARAGAPLHEIIAETLRALQDGRSRPGGPEIEQQLAALEASLSHLLAAQGDQLEHLEHDKLRLQTQFKAALSRAEALERELRAAHQSLRARDAEIHAIRHSAGWILAKSIRGIVNVLRGKLGVGTAALYGTRIIYQRLPLSETRRRRVGDAALETLRVFRNLKGRFSTPRSLPLSRGLAPRALSFPLNGSIAVLPELSIGEPAPSLDATVSVIIPTFNAGPEFHWLLRKLRSQKGLRAVEVVVVDSGSTDGTVERAQEAGCKLVHIQKSEFSHSFARNLGAEHASGELLLFTVQDAYPIGDHWLCTLAKCLLHPRTEQERLAAVSCAEFPRSDTELLYNALIDTHYRFLGCHVGDRIGQLTEKDNLSLRMEGQLSDVACLIEKSTFDRYMYHGRYAEDLILGIRLIRDGHRVGMLSSVKVIHSHNRPVDYYVRRVFVDVVFLSDVFPDFAAPEATSILGTFAAACLIRDHLVPVRPSPEISAAAALSGIIARIRELRLPALLPSLAGRADFGLPALGDWVESVARDANRDASPMTAEDMREAERVRTMYVDRLSPLREYLDATSPVLDESVARELNDAVEKTLAMTVGTQLAFIYMTAELDPSPSKDPRIAELKPMLLAGI
jgi:hypothetical protein